MDVANNLSETERLTVEHIINVIKNISIIKRELSSRAKVHDRSKFDGIEKEMLEQLPPKKIDLSSGLKNTMRFLSN